MTKKELRKTATAQRGVLTTAEAEVYSRKLLAQFLLLDLTRVKTIHLFIPIAEKKEPDTFLFIDWLNVHRPDIRIIVPKADFNTAMMTHHVYTGKDNLVKNQYNILEPAKEVIHTGDIDLVFVPLLAFDLKGYRVGYGKGFYDRFLQRLNTRIIGLSFFEPIDLIDDIDQYDVALDACITPNKTYYFK